MSITALRKAFADSVLACARADDSIVIVTTDSRGSARLSDFAKALPERFVE